MLKGRKRPEASLYPVLIKLCYQGSESNVKWPETDICRAIVPNVRSFGFPMEYDSYPTMGSLFNNSLAMESSSPERLSASALIFAASL